MSAAREPGEDQLSFFPAERGPGEGAPTQDSSEARRVLREIFGHHDFRPGQARAIAAAAAGRDVVVLLPTGGGKSSCFQVPALILARSGRGCTLVISPLLALMHDQVRALRALGVEARALNSSLDAAEQREVGEAFEAGELELLYVSPERAAQPRFRARLGRARVALLAIDEAHCVSQWGHDFRPEYRRLHELRRALGCPTIALTATATRRVLDELVSQLELRSPERIEGGFRRPELSFEVQALRTDAARLRALREAIASADEGRVLVYCSTRKKTKSVCAALLKSGLRAGYYHAGRSTLARERAEAAFASGARPILVATNAFGMGVDYADVRLLVHFQTPGSVEAYYQEAGRAGRDGEPARCLLFFGAADLMTQRRLATPRGCTSAQRARVEAALEALVHYAGGTGCRQRAISSYFGVSEPGPPCQRCDRCRGLVPPTTEPKAPRSRPPPPALPAGLDDALARALLDLKAPAGRLNLARALRGSKSKLVRAQGLDTLPGYGHFADHSEAEVLAALDALLADRRLVKTGRKYPKLWPAGVERPLRGPARASKGRSRGARAPSELARALENYRRRVARGLGCKPFMVFHRKVIAGVERHRPQDLRELALVPGLGPVKVERYGADILALVRENQSSGT